MTTAEELIGKTLGPYRIVEEVGKGGMAVVFRAVEDELDREVALKVLSTDFTQDVRALERFKREAQTTASLDHPNIITIYGIGEEGGLHYFAMEYLPYQSLHDIIQKDGKLPIDRAVEVVQHSLHGLGAAHEAGVIHRDLKPENIMMNADGDPILVDFGIAKTGKGHRLTQTGVLLGTPYYMSPEQITGKEVQVQSDLYSMGVVLYELLTAEVPFQADSTFMITYKHCTEAPPPPRKLNEEISEDLQKVVLKSLEKDLRKRYQSAREFADDLARVMGGGAVDIEVTRKRDIYEIAEFKQGMARFREKDFEAARECFLQVVEDVPDPEYAAEANRWYASSFAEEGDHVTAYRYHHVTAQRWPESEQAKGVPVHLDGCLFQQVQRGERLLAEEGREAARDCFQEMLELLDDLDVPEEERLDSHWIQDLERRAEDVERQIVLRRRLKMTLLGGSVGSVLGVVVLYLFFVYVSPFLGHTFKARIEGLRGSPEGMVREYRAALEVKPGHVPTLARLAEPLVFLGRTEEAREVLEQALTGNPTQPMAHELLGDLDMAAGNLEAAEHHFRVAIENAVERPEARAKFGRVKGLLGLVEEEIDFYDQALRLRPDYMRVRNWKALALWRGKRDPVAALEELKQAVKIRQDHGPSYHNMGKILLSIGEDGAAEKAFLEALRYQPTNSDTHYHLAVIYSRLGRRAKARKHLEDALAHAPEGAETHRYHYLLGQIYEGVALEASGAEANELRARAEQHLREAALQKPDELRYWRRLGAYHWSLGNWGDAGDAYARWAELAPTDPEPAFRLGMCHLKAGRPGEAAGFLRRAAELDPARPEYRHHLALALRGDGRAEQAEQTLRQGLAAHPGYLPSLRLLHDTVLAARRYGEVAELGRRLEAAAEAVLAGPDPSAERRAEAVGALATAGKGLLAAQQIEESRRLLERALELDPDQVDALNQLGLYLVTRPDSRSQGIEMLRRSLGLLPLQNEASRLRQALAEAKEQSTNQTRNR